MTKDKLDSDIKTIGDVHSLNVEPSNKQDKINTSIRNKINKINKIAEEQPGFYEANKDEIENILASSPDNKKAGVKLLNILADWQLNLNNSTLKSTEDKLTKQKITHNDKIHKFNAIVNDMSKDLSSKVDKNIGNSQMKSLDKLNGERLGEKANELKTKVYLLDFEGSKYSREEFDKSLHDFEANLNKAYSPESYEELKNSVTNLKNSIPNHSEDISGNKFSTKPKDILKNIEKDLGKGLYKSPVGAISLEAEEPRRAMSYEGENKLKALKSNNNKYIDTELEQLSLMADSNGNKKIDKLKDSIKDLKEKEPDYKDSEQNLYAQNLLQDNLSDLQKEFNEKNKDNTEKIKAFDNLANNISNSLDENIEPSKKGNQVKNISLDGHAIGDIYNNYFKDAIQENLGNAKGSKSKNKIVQKSKDVEAAMKKSGDSKNLEELTKSFEDLTKNFKDSAIKYQLHDFNNSLSNMAKEAKKERKNLNFAGLRDNKSSASRRDINAEEEIEPRDLEKLDGTKLRHQIENIKDEVERIDFSKSKKHDPRQFNIARHQLEASLSKPLSEETNREVSQNLNNLKNFIPNDKKDRHGNKFEVKPKDMVKNLEKEFDKALYFPPKEEMSVEAPNASRDSEPEVAGRLKDIKSNGNNLDTQLQQLTTMAESKGNDKIKELKKSIHKTKNADPDMQNGRGEFSQNILQDQISDLQTEFNQKHKNNPEKIKAFDNIASGISEGLSQSTDLSRGGNQIKNVKMNNNKSLAEIYNNEIINQADKNKDNIKSPNEQKKITQKVKDIKAAMKKSANSKNLEEVKDGVKVLARKYEKGTAFRNQLQEFSSTLDNMAKGVKKGTQELEYKNPSSPASKQQDAGATSDVGAGAAAASGYSANAAGEARSGASASEEVSSASAAAAEAPNSNLRIDTDIDSEFGEEASVGSASSRSSGSARADESEVELNFNSGGDSPGSERTSPTGSEGSYRPASVASSVESAEESRETGPMPDSDKEDQRSHSATTHTELSNRESGESLGGNSAQSEEHVANKDSEIPKSKPAFLQDIKSSTRASRHVDGEDLENTRDTQAETSTSKKQENETEVGAGESNTPQAKHQDLLSQIRSSKKAEEHEKGKYSGAAASASSSSRKESPKNPLEQALAEKFNKMSKGAKEKSLSEVKVSEKETIEDSIYKISDHVSRKDAKELKKLSEKEPTKENKQKLSEKIDALKNETKFGKGQNVDQKEFNDSIKQVQDVVGQNREMKR